MKGNDAPADPAQDPVGDLLLGCLDQQQRPTPEELERLCVAHPEHAGELRQRFELLEGLGFLEVTSQEPRRRFGDFTLLRKIGEGGFGVVHLARQESLGRRVALKLLRPGLVEVDGARARFQREVQVTAQLEHVGICPLLEAGEVEGVPYLAMRYVPGETLDRKIAHAQRRGEPLPLDQVLRWTEQVARALHAAHEVGLVHRDVKPGNILVDREGHAFLLDFGLARLLDDGAPGLTHSGEVLGTPAYLAPEQIERGDHIDGRTDVYGLGVVLYELLARRCPFEARTREALYRAILTSRVPDLRRISRHVPADLRNVVACAMDRNPDRRYATAFEFAEDLARARRGEPVHARPLPVHVRLLRWSARNRTATGGIVALVVGLVVAMLALGESSASRVLLQAKGLAQTYWNVHDKDPGLAALVAVTAVEKARTPETVATARAVLSLPTPVAESLPDGQRGGVLAVSPDNRFAVWSRPFGRAGEIEVWDLEGGSAEDATRSFALQERGAPEMVFAPDSRRIAVAGGWSDPFVRVIDVEGNLLARAGPFAGSVVAVDWHPSRDLLAVGTCVNGAGERNGIYLWDLDSAEERWRTPDTPDDPRRVGGRPWHVRFDDDGDHIVTATGSFWLPWEAYQGSKDFRVRVWDLEGRLVASHDEHRDNVHTMVIRDGTVLTVGFDRRAVYWPFANGGECVPFEHPTEVRGGDLSPLGDGFATVANDGFIRIFDTHGAIRVMFPSPLPMQGILYSPAGDTVLVRLVSDQYHEYDLGGHLLMRLGFTKPTGRGMKAKLLVEERLLAFEGTARIWSLRTLSQRPLTVPATQQTWSGRHGLTATWAGRDEVVLAREARPLGSLTAPGIAGAGFSTDGTLLALGHVDGRVELHRATGSRDLVAEPGPPQGNPVGGFAFSADDSAFLTRNYDAVVNLYVRDAEVGWQRLGLGRLRGDESFSVNMVELLRAPAGNEWWVCGTGAGGAWLWRVLGPDPDGEWKVPKLRSEQIQRLHDGLTFMVDSWNDERLVLGCADGLARVFEITETGARQIQALPLDALVRNVAFSADGRHVLAIGGNILKVWNEAGELLAIVRHPTRGGFSSAEFTTDGRAVVTVDRTWAVVTWPIEDEVVIGPARELAERLRPDGFTPAERERFAELLK